MNPIEYFEALVKRDATKLKSVTNQLGQRVDYVEHPLYGDDHPVIAMFPTEGVAFNTTFFDCGDFYKDSDYNSCYIDPSPSHPLAPFEDGGHMYAFELST